MNIDLFETPIVEPFAAVRMAIVQDRHLDPTAQVLYVHYCGRANDDGQCWERVKVTAQKLGVSPRTLHRKRQLLADRGYIDIHRRSIGRSSVVTVRRHPKVQFALRKQLMDTATGPATLPQDGAFVGGATRGTSEVPPVAHHDPKTVIQKTTEPTPYRSSESDRGRDSGRGGGNEVVREEIDRGRAVVDRLELLAETAGAKGALAYLVTLVNSYVHLLTLRRVDELTDQQLIGAIKGIERTRGTKHYPVYASYHLGLILRDGAVIPIQPPATTTPSETAKPTTDPTTDPIPKPTEPLPQSVECLDETLDPWDGWGDTRRQVGGIIPGATFARWIEPLRAETDGERVVIVARSEADAVFIDDNFSAMMADLAGREIVVVWRHQKAADPGIEAEDPGIGAEDPGIGAEDPGIEAAEPDIEAEDPGIEAAEPDIEAEDPGIEAAEPDIEAAEPDIEAEEPDIEAAEPDIEAEEPGIEAAEPDIEAAEPDIEAEEPDIDDGWRVVDPTRRIHAWLAHQLQEDPEWWEIWENGAGRTDYERAVSLGWTPHDEPEVTTRADLEVSNAIGKLINDLAGGGNRD